MILEEIFLDGMIEIIDKEAILDDFKQKLYAPIPNFWKANITLGKTTELEYYSEIIVGQTFCGRQKNRLKQRLIAEFEEDLEEIMGWCKYLPVDSEIVIRLGRKQEKWESRNK